MFPCQRSFESVRCCVARHHNISIDILERLSVDHSQKIRKRVAINQNTPISILERLLNDPNDTVRLTAREKLKSLENNLDE